MVRPGTRVSGRVWLGWRTDDRRGGGTDDANCVRRLSEKSRGGRRLFCVRVVRCQVYTILSVCVRARLSFSYVKICRQSNGSYGGGDDNSMREFCNETNTKKTAVANNFFRFKVVSSVRERMHGWRKRLTGGVGNKNKSELRKLKMVESRRKGRWRVFVPFECAVETEGTKMTTTTATATAAACAMRDARRVDGRKVKTGYK